MFIPNSLIKLGFHFIVPRFYVAYTLFHRQTQAIYNICSNNLRMTGNKVSLSLSVFFLLLGAPAMIDIVPLFDGLPCQGSQAVGGDRNNFTE